MRGTVRISAMCICVCVSRTRERDIRAYVRVALICAHFAIIVRDRIVVRGVEAVSSVVVPTLLLFGRCSSSERRATSFVTARYSVFRGRFLPKE